MEKAELNNGKLIPYIGLGVYRMEDTDVSEDIIAYAISDTGYRHIDTAAYYKNEHIVGKAIKKSGVSREELFITTKVWNDDQRNDNVKKAFEDSLRKLNLDYIDLYLIHWPVASKFVETWRILEEIYQSGCAKSIGVSNFKEHHLETLKRASSITPVINQIEMHPYLNQDPLRKYCKENNIGVAAWSPLGAGKTGLLEDKLLINIAKEKNKSVAQIILRWDFQRNVITIPKSSDKGRLKENIDIFDFSLSDDEIQLINSLNRNQRLGADPDNFPF